MDKATFIKIKINGTTAQFKQLMDLKRSSETSELMDFCTYMHPNECKHGVDGTCNVNTSKSHFIYTIYITAIVKTDVYKEKKTIYWR